MYESSYRKIVGQTRLFNLGIAAGLREGKLRIQIRSGEGWALPVYFYLRHTT